MLFWLLASALWASSAEALAPEYQARIQRRAIEHKVRKPAYVYRLGGNPLKGFLDCSVFVQKLFEDAEIIKGHPRTQAWRIYKGLDGFTGRAVEAHEDAAIGDILCLAVPGSLQRPYGVNHVGMVIRWNDDLAIIDANASTKGIRVMPIESIWLKHLADEGWRRITIGD